MVRLAAALLVILGVCGCATKYPKPVVEPATRPFAGIAARLLTEGSKARVLFVHGMCSHKEKDWITDGWDVAMKEVLAAQFRASSPGVDSTQSVKVIPRTYDLPGGRQILASFVLWSPLTEAAKKQLVYDRRPKDGGEFPLERAKINGTVKDGLINDCFSDAMIYAGQRGPDLRRALAAAICSGTAGCNPGDPLFVVTESLGSKMAFDVIMDLPPSDRTRLLAATHQMFMMANQLPLLGLAFPGSSAVADNAAPPVQVQLAQAWLGARADAVPGLSVVAFTDPNDLLSYRLRASDFPGIDVRNVLGSNTKTYLGLVADPGAAHTAYEHNAEVQRLVLCGYLNDDCRRIKSR